MFGVVSDLQSTWAGQSFWVLEQPISGIFLLMFPAVAIQLLEIGPGGMPVPILDIVSTLKTIVRL